MDYLNEHFSWNWSQVNAIEHFWCQYWCRQWLGSFRQKAIIWAIAGPYLCCNIASLGHNELNHCSVLQCPNLLMNISWNAVNYHLCMILIIPMHIFVEGDQFNLSACMIVFIMAVEGMIKWQSVFEVLHYGVLLNIENAACIWGVSQITTLQWFYMELQWRLYMHKSPNLW